MLVQAFSIERKLGADAFYAVYRNASTGWRIEGSFSADDGIEFFICDEDNYTRWERGESAFLYEHSEDASSKSFNFTIPYDSVWYVIFSNVPSMNVINLSVDLYYIDLSDNVQTQISWFTQSTVLTPGFITLLLILPAAILIGVWISRRSEPFPVVDYDAILSGPG